MLEGIAEHIWRWKLAGLSLCVWAKMWCKKKVKALLLATALVDNRALKEDPPSSSLHRGCHICHVCTRVPAFPAITSPKASSEPMAAHLPVCWLPAWPMKEAAACTFGSIDPAVQCHVVWKQEKKKQAKKQGADLQGSGATVPEAQPESCLGSGPARPARGSW